MAPSLSFVRVCSAALILGWIVLLFGCGGWGNGREDLESDSTELVFTVNWAERTRAGTDAPASALSLQAAVTRLGETVPLQLLVIDRRTDPTAYSEQLSIEQLEPGEYVLRVDFFVQPDAGFAICATALKQVFLHRGRNDAGNINTTNRVAAVEVPRGQTALVGTAANLIFTAIDVYGGTIALTPGSARWSLESGEQNLSLSRDGIARGLAPGVAQVNVEVDGVEGLAREVFVRSASASARILFSAHGGGLNDQIFAIDPDGANFRRLTQDTGLRRHLRAKWSPDCSKIVFDDEYDIFVMDADGSNLVNLTDNGHLGYFIDRFPDWSPDGTKIVYQSVRGGPKYGLYVMDADGSNLVNLSTDGDVIDALPRWSPDGTRIAFIRYDVSTGKIFLMDSDGSNLMPITGDQHGDVASFDWSPDGTQIAFGAKIGGNHDIFLIGADGNNVAKLTSYPNFDDEPTWSPDAGKIAFYSTREGVHEIHVMDSDGTDPTRLTFLDDRDMTPLNPDWCTFQTSLPTRGTRQ